MDSNFTEPVFLFGPPESGGLEIKKYLETLGYSIYGDGSHLPAYWDFISIRDTKYVGSFDINDSLQALFSETKNQKWGTIDFHMGKNFGWGFKLWVWIKLNIKNAKFIFFNKGVEYSLARVLGNKEKYIPSYGTCATNCERCISSQIKQQFEFNEFYKDDCILISDLQKSIDDGSLNQFLAK
jgi:hypothetical protein